MEIYLCCNIFYSVNFKHQTFFWVFNFSGFKFKFVYILAQSYVLYNGNAHMKVVSCIRPYMEYLQCIYSSDVPNVERMHGKMCISPAVHFIFAFLQALFSRPLSVSLWRVSKLQSVSHVFIRQTDKSFILLGHLHDI